MRQPPESLDDGRITFCPSESNMTAESVDPVCGRRVTAAVVFAPKLERDGRTYFFCSSACRALFKAGAGAPDPQRGD